MFVYRRGEPAREMVDALGQSWGAMGAVHASHASGRFLGDDAACSYEKGHAALSTKYFLGELRAEFLRFDPSERLRGRTCWRPDAGGVPFGVTNYEYGENDELKYSVDTASGPQRNEYDADHRLLTQQTQFGNYRYEHDAAGNLVGTPTVAQAAYESGNLLKQAGFVHFQHDDRGRLCRRLVSSVDEHGNVGEGRGQSVTYVFDSFDQLVEARWSDRTEIWKAAYDGLGRRLWREYGGARTNFYWDGDRLAAEQDPVGRVRLYVYANEDALVPFAWIDYASIDAAPASGHISYLFVSPTGMPVRVESNAGETTWQATAVLPYGEFLHNPPPTRLRFAGHFYDEHLELFYNRFRDYDPTPGRYPLVDADLFGHTHRRKKDKGKGGNQSEGQHESEADGLPGKGSKRAAELDAMVRQAKNAKKAEPGNRQHNYSLESHGKSPAAVTTAEANHMGKKFVGDGATPMSSGGGLVGKPFVGDDGETYRRQYREPAEKDSPFTKTGKQSNFETQRLETKTETVYPKGKPPETVTTSKWKTVSDGHVDVTD